MLKQATELCYSELSPKMDGVKASAMFSKPLSSLPNVRAALTEYMGAITGLRPADLPRPGTARQGRPRPLGAVLYAQMKANNQPVELHVYPDKDHSGTVLGLAEGFDAVRRPHHALTRRRSGYTWCVGQRPCGAAA